jgi:hypothetical protein
MADEIKYEYKTVRTVRGTDGLVISKMQKDGWELVQQVPGALRSTLGFRRPRKPVPWRLIGAAAAALVVLASVIGVASVLSDGGGKKDDSDAPAVAAGKTPSGTPATTRPRNESTPPTVITRRNSTEFNALLRTEDSCDEANLNFATRHRGRTVAFEGSIVDMAPHGDYDTRYDILLSPGDGGPSSTAGPAFKYENVNIANLGLTGKKIPATVGEGDTYHFVAEIRDFNTKQCLLYLTPVSTEVR